MAEFDGHRPGHMKQQNKSHKNGRHKSKGAANEGFKVEIAHAVSSQKRTLVKRKDRRNQAKQTRDQKRQSTLASKRKGCTTEDPPLLVTIIPLTAGVDACFALRQQLASNDASVVFPHTPQPVTFVSAKHKRRLTVMVADPDDLQMTLQAAQLSDVLVFGVSVHDEDNARIGKSVLEAALMAQGVPSTVHAVFGLADVPLKRRADAKKAVTKTVTHVLPDTRVFPVDTPAEADALLWNLCVMKLRNLHWRENRPYLLAEAARFEATSETTATLAVSGYLRGGALSANRLVCLPGLGAFQLHCVGGPVDPTPLAPSRAHALALAHQQAEGEKVLARPDPERLESLQSEQPINPLEGEQTWPTADDFELSRATGPGHDAPLMAEGAEWNGVVDRPPAKVRVPKGTSAYQAAWIVEALKPADDDDDDDNDDDDEDNDFDENDETGDDFGNNDGASMGYSDDEDEEDDDDEEEEEEEEIDLNDDGKKKKGVRFENNGADDQGDDMSVGGDDASKYDAMTMGEDLEEQLAARDDRTFPDEVDTPRDIPARQRFHKYRGLESFKTSPWDPKEELPQDYSRIFQFENFNRTQKRVLHDAEQPTGEGEEAVWPIDAGTYVTLYVAEVPLEAMPALLDASNVLAVYGLLEYENKMSVLNYKLTMHATHTTPVKSKEPLLFWSGFRRFSARPVFSEASTGDKHKFERYFQPGSMTVASVYAPIQFPPVPVLVFRPHDDGSMQLLATGALLSVNPDRLVIKRIRLSGHPFKINRKLATIRFMFFTPEDIRWFKSVELVTKYGRRGHIKESLGTHGHMKCIFDGQLNAQDTVLMNLYKRVYPKWSYAEDAVRRRIVAPVDMDL